MPVAYAFTLPVGLETADGALHREGEMRLATALDEIEPLADPAVLANEAYLPILLLARVVTRIGEVDHITPEVVGSLPAVDVDHLQRVYTQLNAPDDLIAEVQCPHCGRDFEVDPGGIDAGLPAGA